MCASGFRIIKDQTEEGPIANEIVFSSERGAFNTVSDNGGKAQFNTTASFNLSVGSIVQIIGLVYSDFNAIIISVESPTSFTLDIDFTASAAGLFLVNDFVTFEDTPSDFMREVQVQFLTSGFTIISITFDGGDNYIPVNDGVSATGLFTFTIFVKKDSVVNFISSGAVTVTSTVGVS